MSQSLPEPCLQTSAVKTDSEEGLVDTECGDLQTEQGTDKIYHSVMSCYHTLNLRMSNRPVYLGASSTLN